MPGTAWPVNGYPPEGQGPSQADGMGTALSAACSGVRATRPARSATTVLLCSRSVKGVGARGHVEGGPGDVGGVVGGQEQHGPGDHVGLHPRRTGIWLSVW